MKYTVAETAQLHMEGGITDLKATDMKIYWGSLGAWSEGNDILTSDSVIEVYLPRFSGGSNLFGAYRSGGAETNVQWMKQSQVVTISESLSKTWATVPSPVSNQAASGNGPGAGGCFGITQDLSSNAFDLKQIRADSFSMCHWDSQKETLRLLVSSSRRITGVYISKVSLFQNYDAHGKQNGLGPLPPIGGIDEQWYQLAHVAIYQASGSLRGCAVSSISDFPSTSCASDLLVYQVPFDQYRSVRFGTDLPPIPTRKGAGGVGTVAPPSFVYAAASGNNDGPNQAVCITVTLVSSSTIYSVAANPTMISLTGLTGSLSPSQYIPLFQSKCQCEGSSTAQELMPPRFRTSTSTQAVGQAEFHAEGTLTLQLIPGQYIQAGEVVTFSFSLNTGGNPQTSRDLRVSLSGQSCSTNDFCTSSSSVSVTIPPRKFDSSSKILEVVGNKLRVSMFQSSSDPGSMTNVFVTLQPNFNVEVGSVISFQGVCGTQTNTAYVALMSNRLNGGTPLTDKCTGNPKEVDLADYWPSTRLDWSIGGPLKLTLEHSLGLNARGTYALSWSWQNVNTANSACSLTVTVHKGGNVVNAEVVENIGSTPISQGQNTLAQITISGLHGSQTGKSPIISACPTFDWNLFQLRPVADPPTAHFVDKVVGGTLHRTTSWASGSAVLTVNQDDKAGNAYFSIPQQQDVVFALVLKNPKGPNPCQSVSLSLSAHGPGNTPVTQTVTMVQNPLDRALEDGEVDGDVCVLKTYDYNFPTRVIAQSSPVVQESNVITITLRSNMNMLSSFYGSQITISGLQGTDTTGTSLLATAVSDQYFPNIQKTSWDASQGKLVVYLAQGTCQLPVKGQPSYCIYAGWTYVWRYTFKNGAAEQASPAVSISSQFAQGRITNPQVMTSPMSSDFHVLYMTRNLLNKYNIGQLNPAPGAVNPVCITLRASKTITAPTTFTLTGLNMFSSSTNVALYDEYATAPLAGGLFQTVGANPQSNYATYDQSTIRFQLGPSQSLQESVKYKFCFRLTNAVTGHATCPQVSLIVDSHSAPAAFKGSQAYLCNNEASRRVTGYPSEPSGCAGYVSDRKFVSSTLRSGSNVTASTAWLTMELQPNYPLTPGHTITVGSFLSMKNAGSSDVPCTIVRNGQVVNSVTNQHSNKGIFAAATFESVCKFIDNQIKISYTGGQGSSSSLVYDPYYDVTARRSRGLYKVEVMAGGSQYGAASVIICDITPGEEFWTKTTCTDAGVVFAAGSSARAQATVLSGTVVSINLTASGSGYAVAPRVFIVDPTGSGRGALARAFVYDLSIYTVQLQLVNQNTPAPAGSFTVSSQSFVPAALDSGDGALSKSSLKLHDHNSSQVVFTVTPQHNLYEGDMLLVNLPAYDVITGPIFGVTSSPNPAFTTFSTQLEWELNYHEKDRARAYVSNGWVADGNRHRSGDGDVDGLFVLSPEDDGYNKNKDLCWSRVSCPWGFPDSDITFSNPSSTLSLVKVQSTSSSLGHSHDICYKNSSFNLPHPSDYVGMQLKCRNNQHQATDGGQVTSVRVRHGGLTAVSGRYTETSSISAAAPTFVAAAAGATSQATGSLMYQVVGVQYMSGSSLTDGDVIVFDSTYQVSPAAASVSSLYSTSPAVHVASPGLYSGFPYATVTGKDTQLQVLLSVSSASLSSQGSGYTSIPTVTTSLKPSVALPSEVQQLELPVFDVTVTNATGTVITQSILDYNPARQCFVVAEEFPTSFLSDCQVVPKEQVGRYTGMTAMIGSNEYVIKQGAGGVYWVADLKGNKPRSVDLANKPYTIYTQLQLQVAKGKWIRQGESVSISIPGYRFKSVPSNPNAFVTPSTDDASKTIRERTRFQFATPISVGNVGMAGATTARMLMFGGAISSSDTCTIQGSDIEAPQTSDGVTVNHAETMTSVGASKPVFLPPSTWGSGYLKPAWFKGTCASSRALHGIFMLDGQRTGVEWIEVVTPGTSCSSNVNVIISSPSKDAVTDALTNDPVCPDDSSLCTQATAVATVSGGSITGIALTNGGSGYFLAPTVRLVNSDSNTPCDAFAVAHLSHNFTARLQVSPNSNLMMYRSERDQYDSLTGLHSAVFSPVSLHKKHDARKITAEVGTGYVAAIVVTSVPPASCAGPIEIEAPPSGRTARAQAAAAAGLSFIQVIDGGYGYEYPPAVSFACGQGAARAILGFTTADVHMAGTRVNSSYTGLQPALLSAVTSAPAFQTTVDSPVVVGFNSVCSNGATLTYSRAGSGWNNSRVTGISLPVGINLNGFAFGFTSVTISPSPVNAHGLVDPAADALAVPTWSFPASGSVLVNGVEGVVQSLPGTGSGKGVNSIILYDGPSSKVELTTCDKAVLVFNPPQRPGGKTLKVQLLQPAGSSLPIYVIVQQGQGYANIPIVVDIDFDVGGSAKSYSKDFADLSSSQQATCRPSYFAFNTAYQGYNVYSAFVRSSSTSAQPTGLTLDGVLMTREGYGYETAPPATLSCSGCSTSQCADQYASSIANDVCTASALTVDATVSGGCTGGCQRQVNVNAFFSPNNGNGMQICSPAAGAGDYRTRKTLQMRVSNGLSAFSTNNVYTVRRSQGFQGAKGSLIFKITGNGAFSLSSLCEVPRVIVEPPPSGGVQAQVNLDYLDTSYDPYTNRPSASLTAASKGFAAENATYRYLLKVVNAGSGYLKPPSISIVSPSGLLPTCPPPIVGAFPRNGLVASRVELIRNISLPEANQGSTKVQPTCSSGSFVVKSLCPGSKQCTSSYSRAELNPLPSCSTSSQCAGCSTFPCSSHACGPDNCPSYLSTVLDASLSDVVPDEALAVIGWDARAQQPVLLNQGFGFSPSSPNPLRLEFPSDSGQAYPCAEILLYLSADYSSEALQPGPLHWPGDLSYNQNAIRNYAGEVTEVEYLFRPGFINAIYGSFSNFPVTTLISLRDQSARRLLQASSSALLGVVSAGGFKVGDYIRLADEVMLVNAVSQQQNTLSVTRGALNTSVASSFALGTVVRTFNPGSVLLQDVASDATTIQVSESSGLNSDRYIQVEHEIMYITSVDASSMTVLRAQEGTRASSHAAFKPVGYIRPSQQYPIVLLEAVSASQTTLSVSDGSFFYPGASIQVLSETMAVTAVSGDTLTVQRGQESTSPAAYPKQVLVTLVQGSASVVSVTSSTIPSIKRSSMNLLSLTQSTDAILNVMDPVKNTSSSGFQPGDYVGIYNDFYILKEVMLVLSTETARVSDYLYQNLTVARAQFQTTASLFSPGLPLTLVSSPRIVEQMLSKTDTIPVFSTSTDLQAGDLLRVSSASNEWQIEVMEYQSDGSVLRGLIPDYFGRSQASSISAGALVQTIAQPAYLSPPYCTSKSGSDLNMTSVSSFAVGDIVSDGIAVYNVTAINVGSSQMTVESLYVSGATPLCSTKFGDPPSYVVKTEGLRVLSSAVKVDQGNFLQEYPFLFSINLQTVVSDFYAPGDFVWIADKSTSRSGIFVVEDVGNYSLNVSVFSLDKQDEPQINFGIGTAVLYKYERFDVINGTALSPGDIVLFSWLFQGGTGQIISATENEIRLKITGARYYFLKTPSRSSLYWRINDLCKTFQLLPVSKTSYARSKLALAINSEVNTMTLFDASGFRVGDSFTVDQEVMTIDNLNGNLIQVKRAQRGTSAASHALDALVEWTAPLSAASPQVSSVTPLLRRDQHLRYISQVGPITLPSSIQQLSSYQNVWAELDEEIILIRQPASGIVKASDRGLRGTAAAAHVSNTTYNVPNAFFSWLFSFKSSLPGASGFSALPVYDMNAAGVIALSGVHVLSGGSRVTSEPTLELTLNRFIENEARGQSVAGPSYSYRTLIQQTFLQVDLSDKFTGRLIRPSLNYPVAYQPWRFPADPLYFQDRMDGFDPASDSSILSPSHNSSNAINGSSADPFEPGSPVFVLDSFGHMLGDQAVHQQSIVVSDGATYTYSISSRPSVLDSVWSSPPLLIVSTSSPTSVDLFLNDTVAGGYSNGQHTALLSSSTRMFVWKTDPRKLAVLAGPASAAASSASFTSSTPAPGVNVGAIVGGVIGGIVGAAGLGMLAYKLFAHKKVAKSADVEMAPVYESQAIAYLVQLCVHHEEKDTAGQAGQEANTAAQGQEKRQAKKDVTQLTQPD
ncbi:hypothetical protein GUITHDRAFT_118136 [Guillardia theta CCMP2712]|uniref:Uncharacterized protein n=1 Tax=Guillardia theta (strain CCMP2712) TaxID=905079 RepID=L1IIK9_GUITC|nr:hypothetical protein GUITHDRAFT_118136 [Guillardia theta CCMP2712]EKX35650.1 hypothetical protein GUITHDRAFT_118136 [Guillardia theta CCMP2712]|eukprot:XP_005822630.1 hypothetical protein GUITHDRAFT_118136 [Guillardia theta CCMP2712]